MLDVTAAGRVNQVLTNLGDALAGHDLDRAVGLFQDDCYWRDLVAFTWNLKTMEGKDAVRAPRKLGFLLDRVEGSNHVLIKAGHPYAIPVPVHGSQALPKGTLASIIRLARIGKKQFFAAIR